MIASRAFAAAAFSLASAFLLAPIPAQGCLHPPREYPGKVGSSLQEYLFYRDSGLVHLIANQRIAAGDSLPSHLAWVIPLPSVPVLYRTESDSLFEKLFRATEPKRRSAPKSRSLDQPPVAMGFAVHDEVKAGEYAIRPIEVLDTAAGMEINDWLFLHGYHRVPLAGLQYYLRPGACFLAIKVSRLEGKRAALHPLHIAYRAGEARVPLKFFANAGVFDVHVYALVPKASRVDSKALARYGLRPGGTLSAETDPGFGERLGLTGFPWVGAVLHRYQGAGINGPGHPISAWSEDPLVLPALEIRGRSKDNR